MRRYSMGMWPRYTRGRDFWCVQQAYARNRERSPPGSGDAELHTGIKHSIKTAPGWYDIKV